MVSRMIAALTVLACLLGAGARADVAPPLTAEQSASLVLALRLWTLGLVGDAADVTVTPAEGGYDLKIPVAVAIGTAGSRIEGGPVTARASLAGDGRWHLEGIALPSPLSLMAVATGADGKPLRITQTFAEQSGTADIDPTLAGPSSGETTRTGSRLLSELGGMPMTVTSARSSTHMEWVPTAPGRVDIASVTRIEDLRVRPGVGDAPQEVLPPDGPEPDGVGVHAATISVQSSGTDPDRASRLMREVVAFAKTVRPADKDDLEPEQRAALHAILALLREVAHGTSQSIVADGIAVTTSGRRFGLDRLAVSQTSAAPDGRLATHMRLELSGADIPGLPPGALRDMVPHRLVLAPYVIGTPLDEAYAMAERTIDGTQGPSTLGEAAQAQLAKAPVTAGLDALEFDLGPARFTAKGQVTMRGPGSMDGAATIEATGVDALVKMASTDPLLKKGVPVLIFLKGIGDQDGDRVVWKIATKDGRTTVNGTDLSGLIPGH